MAKDPAFLFYPGDYLRDTQCFSEKVQVAYDRIMCEHMRNICISKQQLKFFTKRLSEEETEELKMALIEVKGGFQIEWVAESIEKRRSYSDSRRKNRKKTKENICLSYDEHMENENENENVNKDKVFRKPKIEQIRKYCQETNSSIDPETFFNHYESQDWHKANGCKVKNWKATIKTWEKRDLKDNPPSKKTRDVAKETDEYLERIAKSCQENQPQEAYS